MYIERVDEPVLVPVHDPRHDGMSICTGADKQQEHQKK